ncbi:MAG: DUF116 domain-containing protein [candidate division Zixibacteria bacterium]|nr:DUF116 domain-containing protein [candidate division Zixibacteria bacterium]
MANSEYRIVNNGNKGKGIFLFLSILSLLVLVLMVIGFWYLVSPRLSNLHPYLSLGVKLFLGLGLAIISGGLFLIILSVLTERDFLFPHGEKQITLKILFPINLILSRLFGWSKDQIRQSFVAVNNSLFNATRKRISPERILILLSHCLQNYDCPQKVTTDYRNCRRCGKCQISQIIELGDKYYTPLSIATGGTLARKVIVEKRPTVIVAVACERDLTSGIQDVYPIPVYGILNERPFGPCINTRVDLEKIEKAIEIILNGRA